MTLSAAPSLGSCFQDLKLEAKFVKNDVMLRIKRD